MENYCFQRTFKSFNWEWKNEPEKKQPNFLAVVRICLFDFTNYLTWHFKWILMYGNWIFKYKHTAYTKRYKYTHLNGWHHFNINFNCSNPISMYECWKVVCESVWPTTNKSRCRIIKMYRRTLRTIFVGLNQNAMAISAISVVFKTLKSNARLNWKKNSKINLLCFIFCGRIRTIFPFSTPASDTHSIAQNWITRCAHTPHAHEFHFRSILISLHVVVCDVRVYPFCIAIKLIFMLIPFRQRLIEI